MSVACTTRNWYVRAGTPFFAPSDALNGADGGGGGVFVKLAHMNFPFCVGVIHECVFAGTLHSAFGAPLFEVYEHSPFHFDAILLKPLGMYAAFARCEGYAMWCVCPM